MPKSYRHSFTPKKPIAYSPNFRKYDDMKARWITQNPDARPSDYQNAMRTIARLCGV